jgi:hypothetical protein
VEEKGWGSHGPKTGRSAIEEEDEPQVYLIFVVSAQLFHIWHSCSENKHGDLQQHKESTVHVCLQKKSVTQDGALPHFDVYENVYVQDFLDCPFLGRSMG